MDDLTLSRHSAAMNVGVDAKGYQILVVMCVACGHSGHVDPVRVTAGKRFRCRSCRSRRCDVRLVWHEGRPPDNVIALKRAK
jgi:transposase-like protein